MILSNSLFSGVMHTVDSVIMNFIHDAYTHFIQANDTIITLLFTLYVMFLGYQFITHHHQIQIGDVMKRIMLMLIVYGLVINWQLYHLFVYNIFTSEPAHISQVLSGSVNHGHMCNIAAALDGICECILNAVAGFFGQASFSFSGMTFILYGVLVFLIGMLLIVYALLLFIYAKMMMAVMLALGPIFILFIMWESTKGLFSSWLNHLITIALIPVITSAVLMLMISVINVTLPQLDQPVEQMQLVGIAPFLVLCTTTVLILSQVLRISSSLGSGIVLSGLSTGAAIAASAWNRSGMPRLINKAGNLGQVRSNSILQNRGMS